MNLKNINISYLWHHNRFYTQLPQKVKIKQGIRYSFYFLLCINLTTTNWPTLQLIEINSSRTVVTNYSSFSFLVSTLCASLRVPFTNEDFLGNRILVSVRLTLFHPPVYKFLQELGSSIYTGVWNPVAKVQRLHF